jgi:TPR repeat protein
MYAKGEGVSKDSTEAVKWFRKAVDQGNAQAQLNLGVMYFLGEGVPRNLVQAHFWLYVANAKGQEAAKKYLAVIEKDMTPDQMADAANLARKMLQKQPKEQ